MVPRSSISQTAMLIFSYLCSPESIGSISCSPLHLYPGEYLLQLTLCAGFGEHFEPLHIVDTLGFSSEQDYALCSRPLGRHAGVVFSKADWQYQLLPAEKS